MPNRLDQSLPMILFTLCLFAWHVNGEAIPNEDRSHIDENGTAHVTRVVPIPKTVSPEAHRMLARPMLDDAPPQSLAERRSKTDEWQNRTGAEFEKRYRVKVEESTVGGVRTRIITPVDWPAANQSRVLINVHGGGFNSDSGSLTETVPIAALTKTKVIAVLYRLAPEHPFPAAVDDTVAVYREVLKTVKPANIGLYGTSAGAILTAEVAAQFRKLGLPLPGALGIFSGLGDFSRLGDSIAIYSLWGLSGPLSPPTEDGMRDLGYMGNAKPNDPVLSPIFADLSHFPPTLFITSTRDLLLSGTVNLQRAYMHAGVETQLVVFDALPHAFWNDPNLPETKEADELMASFFDRRLGR